MDEEQVESEKSHPVVFPIALRANEGVLTERLVNYVRAFSPVVQDLDELSADLAREITYDLSPQFLVDFSEVHDIINLPQHDRSGQDAARAWTAKLLEEAIEYPLPLALPAGTLLELVNNIARAGGQSTAVPSALRRAQLDETAGLMTQPKLEEVFAQLPTRERLSASISKLAKNSSAANGYERLAGYIRDKSLGLLHGEEQLVKSPWKQHIFTAVYEFLSAHRPSKVVDNSIDALNLALAYSSNDNWRRHKRVCYIIGRSPWLRRASEANPWTLDPAVRNLDQKERGLVRSSSYLYLRTRFGTGTPEEKARQYVRLGRLHRDLREVIDLMTVATRAPSLLVPNQRAPKVILMDQHDDVQGALLDAVKRLSGTRYSRDLTVLYAGWEAYRRLLPDTAAVAKVRFFPRSGRMNEPSTKVALEEIVAAAEQAREDAIRQAEGQSSGTALQFAFREASEPGFSEYTCALFLPDQAGPIVHLSVIANDYYSVLWHSTLDIHSLLDWIDTYASQVNWLTSRHKKSLYYPRPINGHCLTIKREQMPQSGLEFTEECPASSVQFGDVPLSRSGRQSILAAANAPDTEAVRLYTPYGDFWLNFLYTESGALRTGFVSHVPAPAFLAQLVAFTSAVPLPASRLFRFFQQGLVKLQGSLGDSEPPAGESKEGA